MIVIGVSGSGKSSLAKALVGHYGLPFVEGDDLHPPRNIEKMVSGTALDDDDRWPWLDSIADHLNASCSPNGVIGVCSALRRRYRDRLRERLNHPPIFIFLDTSREVLYDRLTSRIDHFMPRSLLESQLATLEQPIEETDVISITGNNTLHGILSTVIELIDRQNRLKIHLPKTSDYDRT